MADTEEVKSNGTNPPVDEEPTEVNEDVEEEQPLVKSFSNERAKAMKKVSDYAEEKAELSGIDVNKVVWVRVIGISSI